MDEVVAMKKAFLSAIAVLFCVSMLTACTNRDMSTVGGAALGGLAGNVITGGSAAGTVVGAVGGGLIGRSVSH